MDLIDEAIDPVAVLEGAWKQVDSETKVKVARYGNKNFRKAIKEYTEEALKDGAELTQEQKELIATKAIAKAILVGWEGMKKGGKEYQYSYENALAILINPAFEDFREMVIQWSTDKALFREQQLVDLEAK
jgi:hypothetical protein